MIIGSIRCELIIREALLPINEQMPNESYAHNDRIKAYITKVEKTTKGPQILISRTHPGLLKS